MKLFFYSLMLIAFAGVLVGCSNQTSSSPSPTATDFDRGSAEYNEIPPADLRDPGTPDTRYDPIHRRDADTGATGSINDGMGGTSNPRLGD